jgi:hypothetical protein
LKLRNKRFFAKPENAQPKHIENNRWSASFFLVKISVSFRLANAATLVRGPWPQRLTTLCSTATCAPRTSGRCRSRTRCCRSSPKTRFASAVAHRSSVVTPLASAAQNFDVGHRRPCQGQAFSRRRATRQMYNGTQQIFPALSAQWKVSHCGDVPSVSSSRWLYLCGGADACYNSCYAACACGTKPRRGPPAAPSEADV